MLIKIFIATMAVSLSAQAPVWDLSKVDRVLQNSDDPTYNAVATRTKNGGVRITQSPFDVLTWGKVAILIRDLDFDRHPVLTVRLGSLDPSCSLKVGADKDWKDFHVLLTSQVSTGRWDVDLARETGWFGRKSFLLILIVEGPKKTVTVDLASIRYTKSK